jgi:hypothetical protein
MSGELVGTYLPATTVGSTFPDTNSFEISVKRSSILLVISGGYDGCGFGMVGLEISGLKRANQRKGCHLSLPVFRLQFPGGRRKTHLPARGMSAHKFRPNQQLSRKQAHFAGAAQAGQGNSGPARTNNDGHCPIWFTPAYPSPRCSWLGHL